MITVIIADHAAAFQRAHGAVIAHLGGSHGLIQQQDHWLAIQQAWRDLHGARVPGKPGRWTHIQFDSAADFTVFLLKWS